MKYSIIETAGFSLETLIENLQKICQGSKLEERERSRIFRDIILYSQNFLELFLKGILDEKWINQVKKEIKNRRKINTIDLIKLAIKKNKINNESKYKTSTKSCMINMNTIRNSINHSYVDISKREVFIILEYLINIIPLVHKYKNDLKIEKNLYEWFINEQNLMSIFLIMEPMAGQISSTIYHDRESAIVCNNYFIGVTKDEPEKILKILINEYKFIDEYKINYDLEKIKSDYEEAIKKELKQELKQELKNDWKDKYEDEFEIKLNNKLKNQLKKTIDILIKYQFIQNNPSWDEFDNYETNGIIFRRDLLPYSDWNPNKSPEGFIKNLFSI